MITLFACPKPFRDPHIALIQRNAIASWVALRPRPTIILFGDEQGIAEVSREFGLVHVPSVARNALGTPLVSDIFRKAEAMTLDDAICYVNADIILMDDFMHAIEACANRRRPWLMGGRPWDLAITQTLEMQAGWQDRLVSEVRKEGVLRCEGACDYFAFSRGLWGELPPFAIGRTFFDNALLYRARRSGAALIDGTPSVVALHQSHGYPAALSGDKYYDNPECYENVRLAGGWGNIYNWKNASHRIIRCRIKRSWTGTLRLWGQASPRARRILACTWYPLLALTKPVRRIFGLDRKRVVNAVRQLRKPKEQLPWGDG